MTTIRLLDRERDIPALARLKREIEAGDQAGTYLLSFTLPPFLSATSQNPSSPAVRVASICY